MQSRSKNYENVLCHFGFLLSFLTRYVYVANLVFCAANVALKTVLQLNQVMQCARGRELLHIVRDTESERQTGRSWRPEKPREAEDCEDLIRGRVLDTKQDAATPEHVSPRTLVAFSLPLHVTLNAGPKVIADFNSVNSSLGVYIKEIISVSQRVT